MALLTLWIGCYEGAMLFAALTTDITFGWRLLFPALPAVVLIGAVSLAPALSTGRRARSSRLGVTLLVATFMSVYVVSNVHSLMSYGLGCPHDVVAKELERPTAHGDSLAFWIRTNIPPSEALLSTNGQAAGYVLHRNVVSTVGNGYSDYSWEDAETLRVMQIFGARYILVFRDALFSNRQVWRDPVLAESRFLRSLERNHPPTWLELAASTPNALLFRRQL